MAPNSCETPSPSCADQAAQELRIAERDDVPSAAEVVDVRCVLADSLRLRKSIACRPHADRCRVGPN